MLDVGLYSSIGSDRHPHATPQARSRVGVCDVTAPPAEAQQLHIDVYKNMYMYMNMYIYKNVYVIIYIDAITLPDPVLVSTTTTVLYSIH